MATNKKQPENFNVKGKVIAIHDANDFKTDFENRGEWLVELDTEFSTLKNGEPATTTRFAIQPFSLVDTASKFVKELAKGKSFKGNNLPRPFVVTCLQGAEITIARTFRQAGEARQYGDGVYNTDCYTSEIVSIVPNIDPEDKQLFIMPQLLRWYQGETATAPVAMPNPW